MESIAKKILYIMDESSLSDTRNMFLFSRKLVQWRASY